MQKTQARKHSYSASAPKAKSARKTKTDYYDYSLVAIIVLLICFGLIMLYSTSAYRAEVRYGDDMYFFKKQAADQYCMHCDGALYFEDRLSYPGTFFRALVCWQPWG